MNSDSWKAEGESQSFLVETSRAYWELAIPASLSTANVFFQETINMLMAGHLGNPQLIAAVGLGNLCYNCFALVAMEAANSALESLVP